VSEYIAPPIPPSPRGWGSRSKATPNQVRHLTGAASLLSETIAFRVKPWQVSYVVSGRVEDGDSFTVTHPEAGKRDSLR
jgi:hypothetical protein